MFQSPTFRIPSMRYFSSRGQPRLSSMHVIDKKVRWKKVNQPLFLIFKFLNFLFVSYAKPRRKKDKETWFHGDGGSPRNPLCWNAAQPARPAIAAVDTMLALRHDAKGEEKHG